MIPEGRHDTSDNLAGASNEDVDGNDVKRDGAIKSSLCLVSSIIDEDGGNGSTVVLRDEAGSGGRARSITPVDADA
jgi:hypothetical protein